MALDFSNGLFGSREVFEREKENFVVSDSRGTFRLIYGDGKGDDITGFFPMAIYAWNTEEDSTIRGYKATIQLYNSSGAQVTFDFAIGSHGGTIWSNSNQVIVNGDLYSVNVFFTLDEIYPGEAATFTLHGDYLGSSAGAKYLTFYEVGLEAIKERKNEVL